MKINKINKIFLIITFLFFTHFPLYATPKNYGNTKVLEVTSIYDADTFKANIEGWPPTIGQHVSIRVNDIDAPEMRDKCLCFFN